MKKDLIAIDNITIHQDENGRFLLTDLWKASGGDNKRRPSIWLENKTTEEKVEFLRSRNSCLEPLQVIKGGRKQGTYVSKPLVYDYAMWISPEFNFKVIDIFDAVINDRIQQIDKAKLRHAAASTNKVQNAILKLMLEQEGKVVKPYHFSNEARLVNWALTGEFKGLNRDNLSLVELSLLASIEERNAILIGAKVPYETRKALLHQEVSVFIASADKQVGHAA